MTADDPSGMPSVTAVVLAGGTSRRFGSDKLAAEFEGTTVLDHLLDRLPTAWAVLCVGAPRATTRSVAWVHEDPPHGGPLAGIAAAVAALGEPGPGDDAVVVVLAGDMPRAAGAARLLVDELLREPRVGAVVARDESGHANPLLTAYRQRDLADHLPRPAHDRAAKLLLSVPHRELPILGHGAHDIDTRADLRALSEPRTPDPGV